MTCVPFTNVSGNGEAADHDGMGMDDGMHRDDGMGMDAGIHRDDGMDDGIHRDNGMGMDDSIDRDDGMERDGVKRDDGGASGVRSCGGVLQDCGKGMYVWLQWSYF